MTCNGRDGPGSLAFAMNALLLRPVEAGGNREITFRPTDLSAYACHDESFAVFSCYGTLERTGTIAPGVDAIERITIQPVIMKPRKHRMFSRRPRTGTTMPTRCSAI